MTPSLKEKKIIFGHLALAWQTLLKCIFLQVLTDEGSHHDNPEVLDGLGSEATIPAHAGGLHAAAGSGAVPRTVPPLPALARTRRRAAGPCTRLPGAPYVCTEDVGYCQNTVAC